MFVGGPSDSVIVGGPSATRLTRAGDDSLLIADADHVTRPGRRRCLRLGCAISPPAEPATQGV